MRVFACPTISISAPVLAEILEEHFTRHSRGGKLTKVIVFTQLRATVRAIVADLADTKGVWVTMPRHAQGADRLTVMALADTLLLDAILFYDASSLDLCPLF